MAEDRMELLRQARQRAVRVLADLQKHQAELEADPTGNLPADQIEAGRASLRDAVQSAQRTLDVLDKLIAGGEKSG
jgi:hypothetical protein